MGANDDASTALLLIFCSLDSLRRIGGPFGVLATTISCVLLIVGIVWVIIWANQTADNLKDSNSSSADGRRHTPTTNVDSFWMTILVVFLILSILSTPSCYYVPRSMRRDALATVVPGTAVTTEAVSYTHLTLPTILRV